MTDCMRGLLAPDPSVLRLSGKFPANPVYAPADPRNTRPSVRNYLSLGMIRAPGRIQCTIAPQFFPKAPFFPDLC